MNELSSYAFSPLRKGDIALYRGSGNGLAPILLAVAEETSPAGVERLQHEYALREELDADWAARPVALTLHNGATALVLEDPGGAPADRLLGRPLELFIEDTASNESVAVGNVRKLIQRDKVDLVLGGITSSMRNASVGSSSIRRVT